ncbi:MAG: hypothetical protein HQL52_08845 [Magnetococcales bacterium]|nr:hypothetical protein [Magnetococcales bacterium]
MKSALAGEAQQAALSKSFLMGTNPDNNRKKRAENGAGAEDTFQVPAKKLSKMSWACKADCFPVMKGPKAVFFGLLKQAIGFLA